MNTVNKQIVLRSSSSGFAWGDLIFSHYKSSCLRWILVSSHRSFVIDPKYSILGKLNEDLHEKELIAKGQYYVKEMEVESPTTMDGVVNKGHIDFLVGQRTLPGYKVDELKHVQSKNVYREVIKKGHFITDNLAQTVNYMLHAQTDHGLLKYSYYEKGQTGEPVLVDSREFKVGIDKWARITVDDQPTKFHVQDQYNHQHQAAQVLLYQRVAQRPYNGEIPFVGACGMCPINAVCAQWDRGSIESTEAFVEVSKQQLEVKEKEHE